MSSRLWVGSGSEALGQGQCVDWLGHKSVMFKNCHFGIYSGRVSSYLDFRVSDRPTFLPFFLPRDTPSYREWTDAVKTDKKMTDRTMSPVVSATENSWKN